LVVIDAILPALASLVCMIVVWTRPVADALTHVGVWLGGWLPPGTVWRPLGAWSETGPPYILDSPGLERWLSGPAILAALGLVVARLGLHAAFARRVPMGGRAFLRDATVMLALVAIASAVWMLAWGAAHGRLAMQQRPLPLALGGACISLMWLGACVLYALWLSRDRAGTAPGACLACGYEKSAAPGPCSECGRTVDQARQVLARRNRRKTLLRACVLLIGTCLITAPYSMTLIARAVPYSLLDAIASRLPPSW
jgi:hypothetical protein